MRGENTQQDPVPRSAATIVDGNGTVKYHIIPNRLMLFGLCSMGLLALLAIILAYMVLTNRLEIERLHDKITVDETQQGENSNAKYPYR